MRRHASDTIMWRHIPTTERTLDPAATDGELDIQLAIKERKRYDFRTSHCLYRKPGIAVPPKNEGLERAPQCLLPGPERTLQSYVAYYRS